MWRHNPPRRCSSVTITLLSCAAQKMSHWESSPFQALCWVADASWVKITAAATDLHKDSANISCQTSSSGLQMWESLGYMSGSDLIFGPLWRENTDRKWLIMFSAVNDAFNQNLRPGDEFSLSYHDDLPTQKKQQQKTAALASSPQIILTHCGLLFFQHRR